MLEELKKERELAELMVKRYIDKNDLEDIKMFQYALGRWSVLNEVITRIEKGELK